MALSQCTPGYTSAGYGCSYYGYGIGSFTSASYTSAAIADYASCTGTGYQDFYSTAGDSAVYQQNGTYTASISSYSSYPSENCQVWIDFNNNSTWETSERVGGLNGYSSSSTFTIGIPYGAAVGFHRMRVVTSDIYSGVYPSMDPCASGYTYGEARDYRVRIVPLPPCSGTPTAGTAVSTTALACPSYVFTLSLSGMTTSGGMTFQWYRCTTSGGTYSPITGATTPTYSTTESAAYYYHCVVICTASGGTTTSSNVFVDYISACYCSPSYTFASYACTLYAMDITDYKLNGYSGTSIHDVSSCDGTGYLDKTSLVCSLMQSVNYIPTVTMGSYTMNTQTWIDLSDNGTFETSESVGGANNVSYATPYNLTVPITAAPGIHRMRVEVSYYSGIPSYPSLDPCPTYNYGEVRDYSVNIVALPPCTGTPTPGNAISSTGLACPSTPFTLTDTGFSVSGSLAFQWYSSTDSATWTPITGATNYTYTLTETDTMFYKCRIACTTTGGYDSTPGVRVNYLPYCYCTPSYSNAAISCSTYNFAMSSFHTGGEFGTYIMDDVACDGSGYQDHTYMSTTYMQTRFYTDTIVSSTSSYAYTLSNQVWIDFSDNGVFETSEAITGMSGYAALTATAYDTFTLSAATSTLGSHRMRVCHVYQPTGGAYPSIDPCGATLYGEARDYTVNIVPLPPCTGTPTGGTTVSSVGTACPTVPFTLSTVGSTLASGLTYQWYRSTSGTTGTWSAISGATGASCSTTETGGTYFCRRIVCTSSSGVDTSTPVFVAYISYCYCSPSYAAAALACGTYNMGTSKYTIVGVAGTMINDNTSCNGTTNYENLTSMSVSLLQGSTDTARIYNHAASGVNMSVQTWIDYNNDGNFTSGESVGGGNSYHDSLTYSLVIPSTAAIGAHRMRTVTTYDGSGYYYPTLDPCTSGYSLGDARDYMVNIVLPGCTSTPSGGSVATSATYGCTSFTPSLTLSGASTGSGILYQWEVSSTGSTWTAVAGATLDHYTPTVTSNIYYRCILTCSYTSTSGTATPVYLTISPAPTTPSGPSYVCSGASTSAFTSSPSGGSWTSGSSAIATIDAATGVVTGVATGVANITYTLASGCYSIATIYVNPSPFAITGYPAMCAGGTTTLADASAGGTWGSSNPSIATVSASGVVTGLTAGTVTISYTLSTGCSSTASSATRTVTVNPNPSAILGSYSICLGSTTALTSATSGGVWTTSASSVASVNTSGVTSGLSIGTADITYTSPSTGCNTSATVSVIPIVTPTLSVSAAPGYTVCSGTSVTFTSSTTYPGTSPVFVWSVNGTIVGGAPTYTYAPANGDLISCWFQSSTGCATPDTMRASVSMTVHPSLAPSVSISTGVGDTICLGSTATITATPVGGGTAPVYHWWVNGSTAGSTAGSYSYTPANGDVITCRLYSNDICRLADSGSTTKTLTVFAIATPAVGLVSSLGPIVCDGSTVTYTATPSAGGTAPVYVWHVNSSLVGSSLSTYSYSPVNGDNVSVMMTSNFPCITTATANNSMLMTVEANVTPIGTVSVSPGYIVLPGSFATFTSTITSGGGTYPTYQWTRNGASITGATNSTFSTNVLYDGDVICCIVTNNDPCSGSTTFNCINITVGTNVGVNEVNPVISDVTVSPNPNHGAFTIKGALGISSDELVNMEITDMLGQVVYSNKATARAGQLNESILLNGSIANGMYMLSVKSDHVSKVFHFVIEQQSNPIFFDSRAPVSFT